MISSGGTLATLSGMYQYFTIKVLGEFIGGKILVLIDGGTTHNFVNEKLVITKKINTKPFLSFNLVVEYGNITPCKKYVPKMGVISFKHHTIMDDLFIFPLGDSPQVILGVKWLVSLGDYTTNHSTLQFNFKSGGCYIIL